MDRNFETTLFLKQEIIASAPSLSRRPDKVVLVQLRGKERDEKGKLQPAGSKAFSVTDISLEDLYQRFMSVLEK